MNPLVKRIVTALTAATAVVCGLIFLPVTAVLPVMIVLVLMVQNEFFGLVSKKYETMPFVGALAALLYLVSVVYYGVSFTSAFVLVVFLVALAAMFGKSANPIGSFSTTLLAFVYIPVMLSFFIMIPVEYGMKWLLYIVAIVKISDMGGFAFGKAFGKHKMCPAISPNKSWEGLAGSVFASCLVSCAFIPMTRFGWDKALAFGVAAALVGTLGDLVESRFKREVGVKDSSTAKHAGLGGFLDMFDSLVFAPAVFYPFL